ncbi:hypothetical protein WS84_27745 [Burkholderia anthina]|uniref:Rap1a/Tai family immunity protein n=1 Tax=Burkholderia cepacia complex TaxID=87882 RepID=UPI0007564B80|nr:MULTISPECIES: Rap1a/Tai family immunity protein [Burkholderia cepacia complex]KVH05332.1 hypothetical protein WS84_27745 [Burkholderia anthina]KVQ35815.1 hypothetical protein WK03_35715 [Burkholderia cepacia]
MKKMIIGAVLTAATVNASAVSGTTFFNGVKYRSAPELEQLMYLAGVLDGLIASPALYNDKDSPARAALAKCTTKMQVTPGQLRVIVQNYMQANPEQWGYAMSSLVVAAMNISCAKIGTPLE